MLLYSQMNNNNFQKFMQLSPIEVGDSREGLADLKVPSTRAWLWLLKQGLGRKSSKRAGAEASPRSGSRSPLPLKKGGVTGLPGRQSWDGLSIRMMTYGLLEEEQDTPNSVHSVAPKVTHSLQDTLRPPGVRDAFKRNKSPLLGIAPLAMLSYRPAITIFTSIVPQLNHPLLQIQAVTKWVNLE